MVDSGFAVAMGAILFFLGVCALVVRGKWGAVMLIAAGIVWLWGLRREEGALSLFGWLGLLVSIAGTLVYIEAVKGEILKAIQKRLRSENEGE